MRVAYADPVHIELYVSVPHGEAMIGLVSLRHRESSYNNATSLLQRGVIKDSRVCSRTTRHATRFNGWFLTYGSSKAQESPVPLIDSSSDTMFELKEAQEHTISRDRLAMIVGKDEWRDYA